MRSLPPRLAADVASQIGESQRFSIDRPIDGIDASAFLLGRSPTTGRKLVIYYGFNTAQMSIKGRLTQKNSRDLRNPRPQTL